MNSVNSHKPMQKIAVQFTSEKNVYSAVKQLVHAAI